jgi:pyridoxal/pyridoxine/pyridoxamine kinase
VYRRIIKRIYKCERVQNFQVDLNINKCFSIQFILDNQYQTFRINFPRLDGAFTGTGDSFSALILAWFHRENNIIVSKDFLFNH